MYKTAVIFTCAHTKPEVSNERFSWLGDLIEDVKPDYVIDLGDMEDMCSLNTYDTRYPQQIVKQNYEKDILAGQEAKDKLWGRFKKKKKKRPYRIGFEGNHENRIKKAIALDPRLEGDTYGVSFSHLQTDYWYDEYHEYTNSAPQIVDYDGIAYSHYIASGPYGGALSGKHHGHALVERLSCSVTVGHSHELHYYRKANSRPSPISGLVAGCFKGAEESWAGQSNEAWSKGVAIKRMIDNGNYDLQWVSLKQLEQEYGS